jgi:hypothetical protein
MSSPCVRVRTCSRSIPLTVAFTQKRFFARYVDHVSDQTEISGSSRFISGGIGGITSQLMIYPVETLKTQLQSNLKKEKPTTKGDIVEGALMNTAKSMWRRGGMRAYYRGLTVSFRKSTDVWFSLLTNNTIRH